MINLEMANDLIKLGISSSDTLLVHSSLKSLGHIDGGADSVIDTLLHVLCNGTLLMPALSYDFVTKENPVFSLNDTACCVGAIPEAFRKREGVLRSMHPTHSVCGTGINAKKILSNHVLDNTPVGEHSPFALLPEYGGKILMLGCGKKPNTSFHGIEERAGVSYVISKETQQYTLIDENMNVIKKEYRFHVIKRNGYSQNYGSFCSECAIKEGRVLCAQSCLIDAKLMWEEALYNLAKNETYYVKPIKE